MEASGRRIREALLTLGQEVGTPATPQFLFLYACINNFLYELEKDAGVAPGLYGSQGVEMRVLNPADGTTMATQPAALGVLSNIVALQLPPSP
jgi:hypothetical protein